ncbi:MAG: SusE domain-containing protein [Bacteroidales bacterium]|nr:SusE domain-containing protein [Bacteroidales bacterium]
MRLLKNIFWATAATIAAVSCSIVSEDTFSTSPAAPVLDSHTDILITEGTKSEDVTFSWTKARFIDADEILYDVYVSAEDKDVLLAKDVKNTYYTTPKETLRSFLLDNFNFIKNATHSISVFVTVADRNGEEISSAPVNIKVYYYEAAVPAEAVPAAESIVLDKSTPSESVALISWSEARLVYGEDVSYKVTLLVGEGEETVLASGLLGTSFAMTVDALNDAAVSAGAAEDAESELTFKVYACCESIPEGIVSNAVKINVTTYVATFPDAMWLPGSYQGWDPATAPTLKQSAKVKGQYKGFVDLTTADGSDAQFKFSPNPRWEGDFGFAGVTVETKGNEDLPFAVASSVTVAGDNIVVPSGLYYIELDKKFGTLFMVQTKNLEIIGSFAASGWGKGLEMEWNGTSKTWTSKQNIDLAAGDEFKFRFNSNWDYSFGGTVEQVVIFRENIVFQSTGTYKVILDASSSDFFVNALDLNMPAYITMPGDYSGHSWKIDNDFRLYLQDANQGIYKGTVTMYGATYGFKFGKVAEWIGMSGSVESGFVLGGDNGMVADGTYSWEVNFSTNTAVAIPVTKVGMIGGFNGWGGDVEMTFDPETLKYVGEVTLNAGDEWKFRFNGGWDYNYGINAEGVLVQGGPNIKTTEAGTYTVTLDMAHGSYATFEMVKH